MNKDNSANVQTDAYTPGAMRAARKIATDVVRAFASKFPEIIRPGDIERGTAEYVAIISRETGDAKLIEDRDRLLTALKQAQTFLHHWIDQNYPRAWHDLNYDLEKAIAAVEKHKVDNQRS